MPVSTPWTLRRIAGPALAICLLPGAAQVAAAQGSQVSVPTPLTYEQALDLALSRNLNVAAARHSLAIRDAAIRAARQLPNPDVTLEVSRDVPHEVFSFDLPVELGGKRGRRIDVAKAEATLADLDVQTELRAVRRDLRQAFYSVVASDERTRIAESVVDVARRLREAAQARFDTGAAPRLEVLQADLGVTRAETDLDLARSTRAAALAGLNGVLNLPPQQMVTVAGSLSDHLAAIGFDQAVALAATSNIDLLAFDRDIAIEQRRLDLLRAERMPTPVFSVGGVFDAPGEFDAGLRGAVSVGVPLFNRNQGEIAGSVATTTQLRARRDAMQRTIENAVFGTLARIDAQRRQVDAYQRRLVPTATDLESLAEESYRAGRTSVLGVLDAQRSLRDLRREALQAALDLQMSVADLEAMLGSPIL